MAYAFDKILNVMNDKINVFGQPQGGQGGQGQTQGQGNQGEQKTTTDGDVGAGGGPGSSNGGASATVDNSASSNQAAFAAAQSRPKAAFKPFADIGQKLASNEKALQDEADSYVASETGKQNYDIANADIDKAASGDAGLQGKVGSLVSQKTINPVGRFEAKTSPFVSDIDKLGSEQGLTSYFRSQYGPSYSRGAAQFDIGNLQSDPNFYSNLRGLQGKQQDLEKKVERFYDPEAGLQKQVETTGMSKLEASKKAAADYLAKLRGDLEGTNATELKNYQDELAKLRSDAAYRASRVAGGLADPGIQTGISQAVAANQELGKYLSPEAIAAFGLNPADYAKLASGDVTADNFYDAAEANRFNAIKTMLGEGGPGKVAGAAPGELASFDTERYLQDVIGRGSAANETANAGARARIKEIMDNAAARRAQGLERAGSVNYDDIKNRSREALVGKYSREGRDLAGLQGVDINKYFQGAPLEGLTDEDFIDATQANDLNAAYAELMDPRNVAAGRFAEGYNPANYTFDQAGYEAALQAIGMAPMAPPPPVEPTPVSSTPGYRETSPTNTLRAAGDLYERVATAPLTIANAANTGAKKLTKSASKLVGRR